MSGVLVVAETRRGAVQEITAELVGAAAALAAGRDEPVTVLMAGPDPTRLAPGAGLAGASEIVTVATACEHFEPHVAQAAVQAAVAELSPDAILVGHTVDGMALAPALAAANGFGLATDVIRLGRAGDDVVVQRTLYGGKLEAEIAFPAGTPAVLMLRPGAFPAAAPADVPARTLDADLGTAARTEHLGFREPDTDGVDITRSDLLLAIGRGIEDASEIERFEALATRMGGALAVSRPLVDVGWAPSSRQVGQSGHSVSPKVYLALGISGAVQHLAGIRGADTVIAVNSDPDAPIFSVADFGLVGDLFDLADELEEHFS